MTEAHAAPTPAPMPTPQVVALIECMLSTAHVDGIQPQELALIRRFYDEQPQAGLPAFDDIVARSGKDPALLAQVAQDSDFAEQLVLMCLMTGYADGHLSDAEQAHVGALAAQVGVAADKVGELHLQVKDSLIASLAHLPDAESVAALAKTL